MMIRARLAKEGTGVACGECQAPLAEVVEFFRSAERPRRRYRCIAFPAGWTRQNEDGVWKLSRHAQQKRDRGRGVSFRRPDKFARAVAERWGALMSRRQADVPVHHLPAEAICPSCRTRQLLDADLLGVEPWPRLPTRAHEV